MYICDMTCEINVNKDCNTCQAKLHDMMNTFVAIDSFDFTAKDKKVTFKARGDPNLLRARMERYGDHGKIENIKFDGCIEYFPGPHPQPYGFPGSYGYPMWNQAPPLSSSSSSSSKQAKEETTIKYKQHTAPPSYYYGPPPPLPLSAYSYMDPPIMPTGKPGGCCMM